MRLHLLSPDARGAIDPTIYRTLLSFLPNHSLSDADLVLVPISLMHKYAFNDSLVRMRKRWVLLDFLEFGWNVSDRTHLIGRGELSNYGHFSTQAYAEFERWVDDNPPVMTFKRELMQQDVSTVLRPIPLIGRWLPMPAVQSKEVFLRRPIEVFFTWGLSHPSRPAFHGKIFMNAHDLGYRVLDNLNDWDRWEGKTWVAAHVPHYRRHRMEEVMQWQQHAKVSVCLPGAGRVCFRHMEAPVGSIIAMVRDGIAWPHPWRDGENCMLLDEGNEFESLVKRLKETSPDTLYQMYAECQKTAARYSGQSLVNDYIVPTLQELC